MYILCDEIKILICFFDSFQTCNILKNYVVLQKLDVLFKNCHLRGIKYMYICLYYSKMIREVWELRKILKSHIIDYYTT